MALSVMGCGAPRNASSPATRATMWPSGSGSGSPRAAARTRRAPACAAPATSRTARTASRAACPTLDGAAPAWRCFPFSGAFLLAPARIAFPPASSAVPSRTLPLSASTILPVARAAIPAAPFTFPAAFSAAPATRLSAAWSARMSSAFVLSFECPRPSAFRASSRKTWTVMLLNSAMASPSSSRAV